VAAAGLVGWAVLGRPKTVAKATETLAKVSNEAVGWPDVPATPATPATPEAPAGPPAADPGGTVKARTRPATPVSPSPGSPPEADAAVATVVPETQVVSEVPSSSQLMMRGSALPIDPTAYDSSQPGLKPPVLLTAMTPIPKTPDMIREAATTKIAIQVLVNEKGTVDLVSATQRPSTLTESILVTNGLSMAKTWLFRPAMRNGKC
jgi:hypothetical protein